MNDLSDNDLASIGGGWCVTVEVGAVVCATACISDGQGGAYCYEVCVGGYISGTICC